MFSATFSLNCAIQFVCGTSQYDSNTQGVVFEAKGLFSLKTKVANSKQFQRAAILLLTEEESWNLTSSPLILIVFAIF